MILNVDQRPIPIATLGVHLNRIQDQTIITCLDHAGNIVATLACAHASALHLGRLLVSTGSAALAAAKAEGGAHG